MSARILESGMIRRRELSNPPILSSPARSYNSLGLVRGESEPVAERSVFRCLVAHRLLGEKEKTMKIAVTTPTGHVGSAVADFLLDFGGDVHVRLLGRRARQAHGLH